MPMIAFTDLDEFILADTPYFMWGHPHDAFRDTPERREFLSWMEEHLPRALILNAKDIALTSHADLMLYLLRWS